MCARLHVLVALILTVQKRLCLVARARVAGNAPLAPETAARLLRHGELLGGRPERDDVRQVVVETIGDDICWMKFGADGRLVRAWRKVKVPGHAEAVLEAARALP